MAEANHSHIDAVTHINSGKILDKERIQTHRIASHILIDDAVAGNQFRMIHVGEESVHFHTCEAADYLTFHNGTVIQIALTGMRRKVRIKKSFVGITFNLLYLKQIGLLDHRRVNIKAASVSHYIACALDITGVKNTGHECGTFGN